MPKPTAPSSTAVATPEPAASRSSSAPPSACVLSARGYHRVLRVARTLADLEGAASVARHHIAEALSYRMPLNVSQARRAGEGVARNGEAERLAFDKWTIT